LGGIFDRGVYPGYVPQRQIFPLIAASISSSVGFGFWSRSAALHDLPLWQ